MPSIWLQSALAVFLVLMASPLIAARGPLRVLFVGNSLTTVNGLPLMFTALARAGRKKVRVKTIAPDSATLAGHALNHYGTMDALKTQEWDVIVLQDQSAKLAKGDTYAAYYVWPWATMLADAAIPARVVMYETMAYSNGDLPTGGTYEDMQEAVNDGYETLRARLGGQTAHAGTAFRNAKIATNDTSVWQAMLYMDSVHPNSQGTFVVACSMYAAVFGKSPRGVRPPKWLTLKVGKSFVPRAQAWAWSSHQVHE